MTHRYVYRFPRAALLIHPHHVADFAMSKPTQYFFTQPAQSLVDKFQFLCGEYHEVDSLIYIKTHNQDCALNFRLWAEEYGVEYEETSHVE